MRDLPGATLVNIDAVGSLILNTAPHGVAGRVGTTRGPVTPEAADETTAMRGESGLELLIIERADCRAEVDVGIPLGESGPHSRHCGLWNRWSGRGRQVISRLRACSQPYG
jgi:hypothetical protein